MITPTSEAELAETIRAANGPLSIRGSGTRGLDLPGEVLSVAGLSGIALHEPGALTLVAAAGTPMDEIEAALAAENQQLAFEPMDHRALLGSAGTPTIGAVVAANLSGPRRVQVGACRDFLLGVRFVDGAGRVIRNGGRVMKNVTGYDLARLMAGAHGTLGVLTEVALKVLPRPETEATLTLAGLDADAAVNAMAAALGSPFEVTGASWSDGAVALRLEGFAEQVSYRSGALAKRLATFGNVDLMGPDASSTHWQGIRDVTAFKDRLGDVWRVSVKPSDAPEVLTHAAAKDAMLDWGGGLVWLLVPPGTNLRARLGDFAGHATIVRAERETRARLGVFQPRAPELARLDAGLRARFDPKGILNPGLMTAREPMEA